MNWKNFIITSGIIIVVLLASAFILLYKDKTPIVDEKLVECISNKTLLYTQEGCIHCKIQENMFGVYVSKLNVKDCFYNVTACLDEGITATPTWVISGEKYGGIQSIKKLKELTGCR